MYKELKLLILKNKSYKEIFDGILKRYKKTGKLKGVIHLENLSKESEIFLSFISSSIKKKNIVSFKVEKFFEYFKGEKYKELDSELLMKELYENSFKYYKDIVEEKILERENFFQNLPLKDWVEKSKSSILNETYKESPEKLLEIVLNIEKAMLYIKNIVLKEKRYISLPILSAEITRDSHYFDKNRTEGRLFLDYLWYSSESKKTNHLEDEAELLWNNRIVKDEFFNFTMGFNILGQESWSQFWDENQPLNISLYNLRNIETLDAIDKKVFIFENPAVFREVIERLKKLDVKKTIVCTAGQLNLSSLIILDNLVKRDVKLYYSGDFDPEGLGIAEKLKKRYSENIEFFNMNIDEYYRSISKKSIESRLKKLDSIESSEFQQVIEAMKKERMAGYQESLVEDYLKFILEMNLEGSLVTEGTNIQS